MIHFLRDETGTVSFITPTPENCIPSINFSDLANGLEHCSRCQAVKMSGTECSCVYWAFWIADEFEAAINPAYGVLEEQEYSNWIDFMKALETEQPIYKALNETSYAVAAQDFGTAAGKIAKHVLDEHHSIPLNYCDVYIKLPNDPTPVKFRAMRQLKTEYDMHTTQQPEFDLPQFPEGWEYLGDCLTCEPEPVKLSPSPLDPTLDNIRPWPHTDDVLTNL